MTLILPKTMIWLLQLITVYGIIYNTYYLRMYISFVIYTIYIIYRIERCMAVYSF